MAKSPSLTAKPKMSLRARLNTIHRATGRLPYLMLSIGLAALAIGLILISPLGLESLSRIGGVDWPELSNIGQTYGAASAIVSGIALIGVSASLIFQSRALALSNDQAMRTFHMELLRLSIDNPILADCWGTRNRAQTEDEFRQFIYSNMIVSFWFTTHKAGSLSEPDLRHNAYLMFQGRVGRQWWGGYFNARDDWSRDTDRERVHFFNILNEEYQRAINRAIPSAPAVRAEQLNKRDGRSLGDSRSWWRRPENHLLIGFAAGGLAVAAFRRKMEPSDYESAEKPRLRSQGR
jgi:hypothetical protein